MGLVLRYALSWEMCSKEDRFMEGYSMVVSNKIEWLKEETKIVIREIIK